MKKNIIISFIICILFATVSSELKSQQYCCENAIFEAIKTDENIDLKHLASGVYTVSVTFDNYEVSTGKVQIVK